jgi:predicted XRE-type DNA-binding protein
MLMSRDLRSTFTESSGNVFADLGLADAGTRLAKTELARSITAIIKERELTQREAARVLEIDQPKVSAISRGRLSDFSLERLLMLVNRLGMDIDIAMSPNPEPSRPPRMVVHGVGEALAASDTQGHTARVRFD